jgi:hypothetical protein
LRRNTTFRGSLVPHVRKLLLIRVRVFLLILESPTGTMWSLFGGLDRSEDGWEEGIIVNGGQRWCLAQVQLGPSPIDPSLRARADTVAGSPRSDLLLTARGSSHWMPQGVL